MRTLQEALSIINEIGYQLHFGELVWPALAHLMIRCYSRARPIFMRAPLVAGQVNHLLNQKNYNQEGRQIMDLPFSFKVTFLFQDETHVPLGDFVSPYIDAVDPSTELFARVKTLESYL